MAIDVLGRDARGRVFVRDSKDDGTMVLRACGPIDPGGSGGVVIVPKDKKPYIP